MYCIFTLHSVSYTHLDVYKRQGWTIGLTMISALMSGLETAGWAPDAIEGLFTQYIPFQGIGMGWVSFAILGFIIGLIHKGLVSDTTK